MDCHTCRICQTACDEMEFCFNPSCPRNISYKLKLYSDQISSCNNPFELIIKNIIPILKNSEGTIFMTGIGKSSHITKKCVSTWQSLGINTHNLLIQDLFHGDIGILTNRDIIIYITNSGNTKELLDASEYIQKNFTLKQICISSNPSAQLNKIVDHSYTICNFKIKEADILDIIPSVSTTMFMMLLDNIGIHLAEIRGFNKSKFKINHPSGDIGKKL